MIRQARFSDKIKHFAEGFYQKWNVVPYYDINASAIFLGVYDDDDVSVINKHQGLKVVWNTGQLRGCFMRIDPKNVVVINSDRQRIASLKERYRLKKTMFPIKDFSDFKPVPMGDKIYCYLGAERMKREYGYDVIEKFKEISPFEIIYGFLEHSVEYVRDNYYASCFINIKPSIYGGNTSAIEMAYMGRYTIANIPSPFYLGYAELDDMLAIVMNESKKIGTIPNPVIGKFFDTGDEWMDDDFWQ